MFDANAKVLAKLDLDRIPDEFIGNLTIIITPEGYEGMNIEQKFRRKRKTVTEFSSGAVDKKVVFMRSPKKEEPRPGGPQ